ncbi:haloacid dehalogenase type II [Wenxinia marina]|uniref:(S)-2-haloacid dehalogenase n=1 Tax=Wenxinia marina DSM 24838 TaxID=1123501 RepID=A0A0D0QI28_9RHOB|nr:haloacid dehalogenase type II [Wenxinia marina]KIQ70678.1 2-haloalkanoic acid dehalogenase, type II [Wenxinia marina DSM 24838]GGL51367.1 haloacid dehalogenase [Wenxinia marina]
MPITTVIFDAYGTLFDVTAAARAAAGEPGGELLRDRWEALARDWRDRQLDYSWLRATAGRHCDFWQVTQDALDWALAAHRMAEPVLRERLLALYWELEAYPEVPDMLAALKGRGLTTAILSNGSPAMLEGAVTSAGIGELLDAVLSVEEVGVFKPHGSVYALVCARFGCAPSEVLFVSSNGWDAAAAAGYGFATAWVNRAGLPRERLWAEPAHELRDLSTVPELV